MNCHPIPEREDQAAKKDGGTVDLIIN